jgi:general secretion pathway protein J
MTLRRRNVRKRNKITGTACRPAARHPRMQGFTLLEILVALAVFSLLALALTQGTQFGLRAWKMQAQTLQANADLDSTDRLLRQLIERMDPGSDTEDPYIEGSETTVAFTTELDDPVSGTPQSVDIRLLRQSDGALVLLSSPHVHAIEAGPAAQRRTVLLSGVADLSIGYWRGYARSGPPGWMRTWNVPEVPQLLRIHLGFRHGDPRHWPDIVAAPQTVPPD